ncbi:MAG: class A beta-lactamase [Pseudomonadota bacterium]
MRFRFFAAAALLAAATTPALAERKPALDLTAFDSALQMAEQMFTGTFGAAIVGPKGGVLYQHNGDVRFPFASTFKTYACGAYLMRVDAGADTLDRAVTLSEADIVPYSPVLKKRLGQGRVTLREACHATITISDNTAGNIVLKAIGGPAAMTQTFRNLGETVPRLDRLEPELNNVGPNDVKDTTTPEASARMMHALAFGDALSTASKKQLLDWLRANAVGDRLLRAALPEGWSIADKTGATRKDMRGIVAVVYPTAAPPVTMAIYMKGTTLALKQRDAIIAGFGKALFRQ